MGFFPGDGILRESKGMNRGMQKLKCWLAVMLLASGVLSRSEAKSYSSGGSHSYSSHSSSSGGSHSFSSGSHSFSSGGGSTRTSSSGGGSHNSSSTFTPSRSSGSSPGSSKSFNSGGGKSYSSGSSGSDNDRRGYSSGKSYSSSDEHIFKTAAGKANASPVSPVRKAASDSGSSGLTYDTAAARARKEEASKKEFTRFKDSQLPNANGPGSGSRPGSDSSSYGGKPPIIGGGGGGGAYRGGRYIPDSYTLSTRPVRIYNVYNGYYSRPWVTYSDPYNSFFWWWLLDRSLDDRAYWAYNHRYDMDPARYQALLAHDQQLEARISDLEGQQVARDPTYVPAGLDRDLMYSDHYVARAYNNRPTTGGRVAFWVLGLPLAAGMCGFFIWLIWFKRWQTST
jgi:hypothetical protein